MVARVMHAGCNNGSMIKHTECLLFVFRLAVQTILRLCQLSKRLLAEQNLIFLARMRKRYGIQAALYMVGYFEGNAHQL